MNYRNSENSVVDLYADLECNIFERLMEYLQYETLNAKKRKKCRE